MHLAFFEIHSLPLALANGSEEPKTQGFSPRKLD